MEKNDDHAPKVSILLVTYNHERFVAAALDSILMQECEFRYEIVAADDYSTDNTLETIQEYALRHSGIIRILPTQHNHGITKNYQRGFKECRGEYIAVLEGDDYWTSPHKLSRQVKFLHEHRECSLCFNRFFYYYENSDRFTFHPAFEINHDYELFTADKLIRDNFIGNFSACMYRKSVILALDDSLYNIKVYDWMFNIVTSQYGMIGYLPEVMSAYRKHDASTWAGKTAEQQEQEILMLIDIYNEYLQHKFDCDFNYLKQNILDAIDYRNKTTSCEPVQESGTSNGGNKITLLTRLLSLLTPKL